MRIHLSKNDDINSIFITSMYILLPICPQNPYNAEYFNQISIEYFNQI